MKKFFIISNSVRDVDNIITGQITDFFDKNNISYKIKRLLAAEKNKPSNNGNINDNNKENAEILEDYDTDCIIVVGGDGTLIQAARDMAKLDVPIIGVNMGHLGYLAEIEPENIEKALNKLINDDYQIDKRIMIEGKVSRDGKIIHEGIALNDIIFSRFGKLRMVDFKIYVNGKFLNFYSADGVIVSTPTGSTAYNLSAGGPILEPGADIIVITPICSHMIGSRSIVLSANSEIKIEICSVRQNDSNSDMVYFDGGDTCEMKNGDIIEIKKSDMMTKIVKLNSMSFIEILHNKMN